MQIQPEQSLADIVSRFPNTAAILEKYRLDYCCQGKRSLEKASREAGLPVEAVIRELEIAGTDTERPAAPELPAALIDYIVEQHHAYVKQALPRITAWLQKLVERHGARHPELGKISQLFAALREELDMHMKKEELILFPRIKEMEKSLLSELSFTPQPGYIQAPIRIMEHEHDDAGRLLKEIRELSNQYTVPAEGCTHFRLCYAALEEFEADLHRHIHLENNILFPAAMRLLTEDGNNPTDLIDC